MSRSGRGSCWSVLDWGTGWTAARALAAPAGVYLMDEPLKGLDSQTRALTLEVIRQETKDALLVLVTHQEEDAAGADLVIRVEQLG